MDANWQVFYNSFVQSVAKTKFYYDFTLILVWFQKLPQIFNIIMTYFCLLLFLMELGIGSPIKNENAGFVKRVKKGCIYPFKTA